MTTARHKYSDEVNKRLKTIKNLISNVNQTKFENQSAFKEMRLKIDNSFENLINDLRIKQNEFRHNIDSLYTKRADQLNAIDIELHELFGNMSTFLTIVNETNLKHLTVLNTNKVGIVPVHMDKLIENKSADVNYFCNKKDVCKLSNEINKTIESIEKSFNTVENEKQKLEKLCSKIETKKERLDKRAKKQAYSEWLAQPSNENTDDDDDDDDDNDDNKSLNTITSFTTHANDCYDDYIRDIDCESIEILQGYEDTISHSIKDIDSLSLNEASISYDLKSNSNIGDNDGFSRIWNSIASKPKDYWLA